MDNDELKARSGVLAPRDARLRDRTLAANSIRTRHYAMDATGQTLMLNEELAAHAVSRALADRGLRPEAVRMLATGTTQVTAWCPASLPWCTAVSAAGRWSCFPPPACARRAWRPCGQPYPPSSSASIRSPSRPAELVSRSLLTRPAQTPDTGFLRWTLSDGAGAVVVEPSPRPDGLSLRVDWMHLVSHAHDHPVCMSAGIDDGGAVRAGSTWLDNSTAQPFGIPVLHQDMAALPALLELGVAEFDALVKAGRVDPETEHILCHFSAEHFRGKLFCLLRAAGYEPDEERWFTNLHEAGNTGAASIYVMLDAVKPRLRAGDRVLLVVPESGRFTLAFAHLTCVGPSGKPAGKAAAAGLAASPLGAPAPDDSPVVAAALGGLAEVWAELERALSGIPVIRRIEDGTVTLDDYRLLLLNLRQQVVDGGRWISLAAAHFSADLFWLRSAAIRHAADEHRDYQLLERDYAAVGGDPDVMASTQANVGSCALSAFVFHRAGQPDPVDLLGAMFVIEGLGLRKAGSWADRLQAHLGLRGDQVSFLRYHATGDDEHFGILRAALRSGPSTTPRWRGSSRPPG